MVTMAQYTARGMEEKPSLLPPSMRYITEPMMITRIVTEKRKTRILLRLEMIARPS